MWGSVEAVRPVNCALRLTGSKLEKLQACKHFAQTTVPTVVLSLPFIAIYSPSGIRVGSHAAATQPPQLPG